VVYWDCDEYPDYRLFIHAARAAGAKILVFHQRQFFNEQIDDALERLNACELPSQESRSFEERLNELRTHQGSVACIELSFDHEGRIFLFDLRTEWFEDFSEMLDEIQLLTTDDDDEEDDSPITGYFSRN
jgi:hypothetical protein